MDASARQRLIEDHLDLARKAAAVLHPRVREHLDFEELVALGQTGLAEAASRFDPTRGASFATFAYYRVQGEMIDGLRRMTNLPRRVWAKLLALRAAGDILENQAERDAAAIAKGAPERTPQEALGKVRDAIASIQTLYLTSLEAMNDAGHAFVDQTERVDETISRSQVAAQVRAALDSLPEKERALMFKHYFEGKNLLEAGAELGISKSWASRMHAQAVERIRIALQAANADVESG